MSRLTQKLMHNLLMTAVASHPGMCEGMRFKCYEYESSDRIRVLVQVQGIAECEVEMFRLTGTVRCWRDGIEVTGWN